MDDAILLQKLGQAQQSGITCEQRFSDLLDDIAEIVECIKRSKSQQPRTPSLPTDTLSRSTSDGEPPATAERKSPPASCGETPAPQPDPPAAAWAVAHRGARNVSIQWDDDGEHATIRIDDDELFRSSFRRSLVFEVLALAAEDAARNGTSPWLTPEQIAQRIAPLVKSLLGRHAIIGTIHRLKRMMRNALYIDRGRDQAMYRLCLHPQGKVVVGRPAVRPALSAAA